MTKIMTTDLQDKYIGTLIGCASGDALGMPIEGWKRTQIKRYVGRVTQFMDPVIIKDDRTGLRFLKDEDGPLKCYTEDLVSGEFTDDTILTVALAESIVACSGLDIFDVGARQLGAYEAQRQPDGSVKGGFGRTTHQGIENLRRGISPLESGVIGGPGNAPAMKISPIGLYMHARGKYDEGLVFAEQVGRITHLDPRSLAGGVVQAHGVYSVLQGISRDDFVHSLADVCLRYEKLVTPEFPLYQRGSLLSRLEWIREHQEVSAQEAHEELRSSSEAFCSHAFALFMFQKYWDDPIEGMIETVNYGGDCDTTGAIFGALCGAKYGMIFPEKWVNGLLEKDKLIKLGEQMYQL